MRCVRISVLMAAFSLLAVEAIYGRGIEDATGWAQDIIWHKAVITGKLVAFSPDGKLIAGTIGFGEIGLFRVSDGSLIRTLVGHTGDVYLVIFSPDGSMIASGGDDGLALWRVGPK